jgi:hypothetical protein
MINSPTEIRILFLRFITVTITPTESLHQSTASIDKSHESCDFPVSREGTDETSAMFSSVQQRHEPCTSHKQVYSAICWGSGKLNFRNFTGAAWDGGKFERLYWVLVCVRGRVDRKDYANDIELAILRRVSNPQISTDSVTTGIGVQLFYVRKM